MTCDRMTIQSLKAVDAWIDVINANINGGVRTAFKASRLKFGGSNTNLSRAGNATSLPLQFPEPSLTMVNTVIDFSQGAITASTERTHFAIQGEGFFVLNNISGTATDLFTRDGEFRHDLQGYLVHASGLYLYDAGSNELVWDDSNGGAAPNWFDLPLSQFLANGGAGLVVINDKQALEYTNYGATVYNFQPWNLLATTGVGTATSATILTKSLEASNASMTQSVPELSLAQKLFSALTKVLQTTQTNLDGVLNLVR
jgi:flagellar basal body rod protein FlgG